MSVNPISNLIAGASASASGGGSGTSSGAGDERATTVTITGGHMRSLEATARTLIATPGSGKAIYVTDIFVFKDSGVNFGSVATGAGLSFNIESGTINKIAELRVNGVLNANGARNREVIPYTTASGDSTTAVHANTALRVSLIGNSGEITGGGDVKFTVFWLEISV